MTAAERRVMMALREYRLDADLTYAQLAAALGMSERNVYRMLFELDAGIQARTVRRVEKFLEAQAKGRRRRVRA